MNDVFLAVLIGVLLFEGVLYGTTVLSTEDNPKKRFAILRHVAICFASASLLTVVMVIR